MRSPEKIKADNEAAARGEYQPTKFPPAKPIDRDALRDASERRARLNGNKGA